MKSNMETTAMGKTSRVKELQEKAKKLRRESLFLMKEMGLGWLGGSFSSADLITALFFYRMKHDPKNPSWSERDRLVISKGHSCEVFYAALAEAGYITGEELKTYSHYGSRLQTHVDCRTPGIDCSGGSLGLDVLDSYFSKDGIDRRDFEYAKRTYYKVSRSDEKTGIPTPKTLMRLGLNETVGELNV